MSCARSAKERTHFHMSNGFVAYAYDIALPIVLVFLVFALRRKED